jgi:predicted metal-dependent HD superfamily phosphohydrolase
MTELRDAWLRAWQRIGATTTGDDTYAALIARWDEPHRKYHTLQHLRECLSLFDSVRGLSARPAEIEVALWFHDAIYDTERSDNEERSAEWASTAATAAGAAPPVAARIHALVMATKHTAAPSGAEAQLLVDIDLAILGADKQRFAEYERQIREEYSWVPIDVFEQKRRAILRAFLGRPRLYATPHFHAALDAAARANLSSAIGG